MNMKSLRPLGTLTFLALVGCALSAQAETRVRVVRGSTPYRGYATAPTYRTDSCPPAVAYRQDHGRHRGWFHRQPVVYVPVVQRPVVYRHATYAPRHSEPSSFFLHVSEAGTSFGIALGQ